MSFPSGLTLTNKGRILQAKAQTGKQLNFTKIQIGDGTLSGQLPGDMTALLSVKMTLSITKLSILANGQAMINSSFTNSGLASGFYYRELGIFAQDPDVGEILYAYANAGNAAEYIPADSGGAIITKYLSNILVIGNASNVSATIDQSLVFATINDIPTKNSQLTNDSEFITAQQVPISSVNNKTGAVTLNADDIGAIATNQLGVVGGVAKQDDLTNFNNNLTTHLADNSKHVTKDGTLQTGLNSEKINGKTASATPSTTEKNDLIGMINELFQNANNGKTLISNVVGSPLLATDTFQQQSDKMQAIKNTLATNLTNKGQNSAGTESLNNLINKVPTISSIKSIQRGQTTYTGATTSIDVAISSVDITKAIVIANVFMPASNQSALCFPLLAKITSSTNLRFTRNSNYSIPVTAIIDWQVIEFNNVKSLQTGTFNYTGTSYAEQTITIASVDTTKSFAIATFNHRYSDSYYGAGFDVCYVKNATTLGVKCSGSVSNGGIDVAWQVIEFN